MPIYEFNCPGCGHEFEKLVRNASVAVACPGCGVDEVERRMSLFGVGGASGASSTLAADSGPATGGG
ncbi:zinc ribbon domain-containing protein [Nitrospinae bacterium AH-259-F20]|nr:zinc ribbon domain-containing protein [Nitrospinae bacterium AH-259-F20]